MFKEKFFTNQKQIRFSPDKKVIIGQFLIFFPSDIIYMFDDSMTDSKYFSDDNIHPNEIGHKRIALNILKQ